jgi:hypothetical protein
MKHAIFIVNSRLTLQEISPRLKNTPGISTGKLELISHGDSLPRVRIYKEVISRIPREIRHLMLHGRIADQLVEPGRVDAFAAIPKTVRSLHLGYDFRNPLFDYRRTKYLLKMFKTVPSHITAVGFHNLNVGQDNQMAFTTLLTTLPEHVKSLSLFDLHLINMDNKDLEQVFSKIPSHVKIIELAFDSPSHLYSNEMVIQILKATPSHVTTLKLSPQGIWGLDKLIEFLKQTPPRITTLDLSGYPLSDISEEELSQLFAAIPASITTIDLSNTVGIGPYQRYHFRAFESLPLHVKNIILDKNAFGYQPNINYMIEMIRTLPAQIKRLDLSGYNPSSKTVKEIIEIFSAIPHQVNTLDVNSYLLLLTDPQPTNYGYRPRPRTLSELSAILKAIPSYISTLKISYDKSTFIRPFVVAFEDFIKELLPHVTTLDLSNNQLGDLSLDELVSIIKAIPLTVKHIVLRDNYLFHDKSTKEVDIILKALQPYSSNGRIDISFNGDSDFGRIAAASVMDATPKLPIDVWNKILGDYVLPGSVEKPVQQIKKAQCQAFLNELQFDLHLNKLKAKRALITGKAGYEKALDTFDKLINSLDERKNIFIKHNDSTLKAKNQFKIDCLTDIDKAKDVLKQHRGWKKFFADVLSVFCSVLSVGVANLITGKSMFGLFPVKTDSQEKIESFEQQLNKNKPKA